MTSQEELNPLADVGVSKPQNQGTRFIRNTIALASVGQERLFIYDLMGWDLGVEPRLVTTGCRHKDLMIYRFCCCDLQYWYYFGCVYDLYINLVRMIQTCQNA